MNGDGDVNGDSDVGLNGTCSVDEGGNVSGDGGLVWMETAMWKWK